MVDAAAALLDEGGPAAVTFRAVGERVGLSHNAVFKRFRDKESLLASIASRELWRQAEGLRRAATPGVDPGRVLHDLLRGFVRWAVSHPARFRLVLGDWSRGEPEISASARAATDAFVSAVQSAQAAGALSAGAPERIASLLLATAQGAATMALNGHLARDGKWEAAPEDLVDELFELLRK